MSYGGSSGQESDKNGIFIFCIQLYILRYTTVEFQLLKSQGE